MKKTWYCVTSTFDDKGRVTSAITTIMEAEKKPKNSFLSTGRKDVYCDWFGSPEEAQKYVEQAHLA